MNSYSRPGYRIVDTCHNCKNCTYDEYGEDYRCDIDGSTISTDLFFICDLYFKGTE